MYNNYSKTKVNIMKQIKAIISDLDGTLLSHSFGSSMNIPAIDDYTIKVINQIKEMGIKFTIATGRGINDIRKIENLPDLSDIPVISANGSQVFSSLYGECIREVHLNKDLHSIILEKVKKFNVPLFGFHIDKVLYATETGGIHPSNVHMLASGYGKINDMLEYSKSNELNKYLMLSPGDVNILKELQQELIEALGSEAYVVFSAPECLEILPMGASKAEAVEFVANLLGVDIKETMSFGDSENDESMLLNAGISVVVDNCHKIFKDTTKYKFYHTLSNDKHGVARFLQSWFHLDVV